VIITHNYEEPPSIFENIIKRTIVKKCVL